MRAACENSPPRSSSAVGREGRSRTGGSRFRATSGNDSLPCWKAWATRSSESGAEMERCPWAKTELYMQYHDTEWGVPVHDDRLLFEFLILEGAQAGLSWETILKKRENYREAFDQFDPAIVAKYGQKKRKSLLSDAGHRPQPAEDRGSHPKCEGVSGRAGRVRRVRRVHLGVRWTRAEAKRLEVDRRKSRPRPRNRTP